MAAKNISITRELLAHAQQMVDSGQYETISEYMRALVRRDRERHELHAKLGRLIQEGLASGPSEPISPEQLGEIIDRGIERARSETDRKAG